MEMVQLSKSAVQINGWTRSQAGRFPYALIQLDD